jgi:PAS domain S-box-containing protein
LSEPDSQPSDVHVALEIQGREAPSQLSTNLLVSLVLITGIGLSVGGFWAARQWELHVATDIREHDLQLEAHGRFTAVHERLSVARGALESVGDFFDASESVTRHEFQVFSARLLEIHPGVRALAWAPQGLGTGRNDSAAQTRSGLSGRPLQQTTSGAKQATRSIRDLRYPVAFLEPYQDNKALAGLDIYANPVSRKALERARDSTKIALTAPLPLGEQADTTPVVLAFLPVYDRGTPLNELEQRRAHLRGVLIGVWATRMMSVIGAEASGGHQVQLELFDTTVPNKPPILLSRNLSLDTTGAQPAPEDPVSVVLEKALEIGGRQWTFIASAPLRPDALPYSATSRLILLAGLGITGLLAWHLRVLRSHAQKLSNTNRALNREMEERKQAEAAARNSEQQLAQVLELAPDAIVISDQSGKILISNSQTEHLFGYAKRELIGKPVEHLLPETLRARHVHLRNDYQARRHPRFMGGGMELVAQTKDGRVVPVEVSLSPVKLGETQIVTAIVRDVSARKEVEAELRRLNLTHAVLSRCSRSLAQESEEAGLLEAFCRNLVEVGGYCHAVVGYADLADRGRLHVQAQGSRADQMRRRKDAERFVEAQLPPLGNKPLTRRDLNQEKDVQSRTAPSDHPACRALIALPIAPDNQLRGAFVIFSPDAMAFGEKETQLLKELAEDLSLGIATIRKRINHQQALRLLREEVEQEERRRLSALLHDGVGQSVQAVNLGLKQLRENARVNADSHFGMLDRMVEEVKGILGDLRNLSQELRPLFLERMTLREAIQYHCSEVQTRARTRIHFAYSPMEPKPCERVKTQCFLCFREALNNAIRHAKAARIDVNLEAVGKDALSLRISDDGVGFLPEAILKVPAGLGLAMIRERAQGIGGEVEIRSAPDQGTKVALRVPVMPPSAPLDAQKRVLSIASSKTLSTDTPPSGGKSQP